MWNNSLSALTDERWAPGDPGLFFWLDAVLVDSTICLFSAPTLKRIGALCSRSTAQDVQYLTNLQTG